MIADALQRGAEGHLSEIALSTLADGQDAALSPDTHAHLAACDACQTKLADAILEHAVVGEIMAAAPAPARTPWPWIAAASVALFVARAETSLTFARDARRLGRAAALVARSLIAEGSLGVGLVTVLFATVVVVSLAKWVAPEKV